MNKNEKLWEGVSSGDIDELLHEFNSSFHFDFKLWKSDILGSLAHAEMLFKVGIITESDWKAIQSGLMQIIKEIKSDEAAWFKKNNWAEDIHSAIEKNLTDLIDEPGRKLHTARSRNDQVATDTRLWMRNQNYEICSELIQFREALLKLAEKDVEQVIPGYTHLQQAQPISLGHHWMAHYERFTRDFERFSEFRKRINVCPLGSGALAGTTFNIDREFTAKKLGFTKPCNNSLDGVSDRDFVAEHQFASSLLMIHLSQLSEELIIWASQEWKFIFLDEKYATGSSMMPQKRNPDIPELIRGKVGRTLGNLNSILITLKGLPLAYNKDLQEDKEGLFDTCTTLKISLKIMSRFLSSIKLNFEVLNEASNKGFLIATDLADYLVKKNVPFRDAYKAVGKVVRFCMENKRNLSDLSIDEWQSFHKEFSLDVKEHISSTKSMMNRQSIGGTSPTEIRRQIKLAWEEIKHESLNLKKEKEEDPCEQWYFLVEQIKD